MIKILLVFVTILSFNSYANELELKKEAYKLLKNDLQRLTQTLKDDIIVFHWSASPSSHEESWNYFSKAFFSDLAQVNFWGAGYYAANDPISSSQYGEGEFSKLTGIKIKKGTRFLDVRSGFTKGFEIKKETYDLFMKLRKKGVKELGTVNISYYLEGQEYVSVAKEHLDIRQDNHPFFREAFFRVLKELKIEFLTYTWNQAKFISQYGKCQKKQGLAFVLFGQLVKRAESPWDVEVNQDNFELIKFHPSQDRDSKGFYLPSSHSVVSDSEYLLYIHFFSGLVPERNHEKYAKRLRVKDFLHLKLEDYPEVEEMIYKYRFDCSHLEQFSYPILEYERKELRY